MYKPALNHELAPALKAKSMVDGLPQVPLLTKSVLGGP